MERHRCGLLAAWATAWLRGRVSYDDVIDALVIDSDHRVVGLDASADPVPLGWALAGWRERGERRIRAALPVPGDPRGLPGPGPLTTAALLAGQAAFGDSLGLVPENGPGGVLWTAYDISTPSRGRHQLLGAADPQPDVVEAGSPPDVVGAGSHSDVGAGSQPDVGAGSHPEVVEAGSHPAVVEAGSHPAVVEADHDLTLAIRDAARTMSRLDVARWRPEVADLLAGTRHGPRIRLPAGHDPRAVGLLDRASRLADALDLATADSPGGAVTGYEARARDDALRPLAGAVRRALVAAYNS